MATGDDATDWLLARDVAAVAPAWKPLRAPAEQVLAFATGGRVRIVAVDSPQRTLGATPVGPTPREIWWAGDGRRLVVVSRHELRVHGPRGRLLRRVALPPGTTAAGSALAPGGRRLALIARSGRTSRLLLLRLDRPGRPRSLLAARGAFEGLAWAIDGSLLVVGVPVADQWLFVRPRGAVGLESVGRIREQFQGGGEPRRGTFPRPAGWCYPAPAPGAASGQPPCSSGSAR